MNNDNKEVLDEQVVEVPQKRKLNIIPKIVCLFFAVVIWYYVMQVDNPDYKQTFTGVTVSLVNTDELTSRGLSIFTGTSYSADITVSGKKSVINNYTSDDITVKADILRNYTTAGMQVVDLDVTLPSGLTLVSQDNTISVFVDEKTSLKLPVTVDQKTGATTSADYEPGVLTTEYSEVTVKGPKTIIDNIDHAVVKADFSDFGVLESTITTDGTVIIYNKNGDIVSSAYLSVDYPTMKVTYPIYLTKSVPLGVTYKYGLYNDNNCKVTIEPETVEVKGEASVVKKLDTIYVGTIDEKQIEKDKTLTFDIPTSDDYAVIGDVATAAVSITNVGTQTKIFRVENLVCNGGSKNCEILNEYVDVTVRGSAVQLAGISADDITLTCDLTDYDGSLSGEYEFDAKVKINTSSSVWEIGTYKLKISVNQ